MSDRKTASTINDAELDALYDQLAALRKVARGYCPACGRGDAAPTVTDWEQQKQRADQAEAQVADYENRITWDTTCASCARILDSAIAETERRERAEAAIERVRALRDAWLRMTLEPGQVRRLLDELTAALDQPAPAAATQAIDKQEQP